MTSYSVTVRTRRKTDVGTPSAAVSASFLSRGIQPRFLHCETAAVLTWQAVATRRTVPRRWKMCLSRAESARRFIIRTLTPDKQDGASGN